MQDQNLGFKDPEEEAVIEAIRRRHPRDRAFAIARTIPGVKDGHVAVIDVIQNGQKVAKIMPLSIIFLEFRAHF